MKLAGRSDAWGKLTLPKKRRKLPMTFIPARSSQPPSCRGRQHEIPYDIRSSLCARIFGRVPAPPDQPSNGHICARPVPFGGVAFLDRNRLATRHTAADGLARNGPFPPFQLPLNGLSDEIRAFFVGFGVQNAVNPVQRAARKAGWHLLFVDLSASHPEGYT